MLLSYIFSLHVLPSVIGVTAAAAQVFACHQAWQWALLYLCAGVGTSNLMFFISPLPTLSPVGGKYHVGMKEIPRGSGDDDTLPPVTFFYPSRTACAAPQQWLPFGDSGYTRGMAAYSGVPAFLLKDMRYVKATVTSDAPCAPLFLADGSPRPLLLFSHGVAGYARLYTALLLNVAARGAIVAAMAHLDGSGAHCRDATGRFAVPLDTARPWDADAREPQLKQRIVETQKTMARLQQTGDLLVALGYAPEEVRRYVALKPKLVLVGHSFGASAVMATALSPKTEAKDTVAAVVALDPWHVPLERSLFLEPIEKAQWRYATPSLIVHSETWFVWTEVTEFFDRVTKKILSPKAHVRGEATPR
ncbi:1-alkyl-2-acetylglycerophosphocholine esterase [Strigomonas culicis]|uniref:1-alkyl-2-acetylglycerophosphocholine esterase n=1 Tax=Strigomonas culicis TaxID=28005 RepID=S9UW61_9TRYP|nr:1-alkyl-2-acetylglycerophosphocholine esterase [Strigomonas culicis]|eukprot:EPY33019.1 1-alkyl-2-acetylglycerophosphocholine esterase [Strigomonas culicis]